MYVKPNTPHRAVLDRWNAVLDRAIGERDPKTLLVLEETIALSMDLFEGASRVKAEATRTRAQAGLRYVRSRSGRRHAA